MESFKKTDLIFCAILILQTYSFATTSLWISVLPIPLIIWRELESKNGFFERKKANEDKVVEVNFQCTNCASLQDELTATRKTVSDQTETIRAKEAQIKRLQVELDTYKFRLQSPPGGKRKNANADLKSPLCRSPKNPEDKTPTLPPFKPLEITSSEEQKVEEIVESLSKTWYTKNDIAHHNGILQQWQVSKRNMDPLDVDFAILVFLNALKLMKSANLIPPQTIKEMSRNIFSEHVINKKFMAILHLEIVGYNSKYPHSRIELFGKYAYTRKFRALRKILNSQPLLDDELMEFDVEKLMFLKNRQYKLSFEFWMKHFECEEVTKSLEEYITLGGD